MRPAAVLPPLLLLSMSGAQAAPEILPRMDSGIEVRPLNERVRILPALPAAAPVEQRGTPPRRLPAIDTPTRTQDDTGHGTAILPAIDTPMSEIGRETADAEQDSEEAALAAYDEAVAAAIAAFDAKDHARSAEILIGLRPRIQYQADVGMMVLLGYAAMHSNREALAIESMRDAVALADDDASRAALIDVLVKFGHYEAAQAVLNELPASRERGQREREIAVARAWRAHDAGRHSEVLALLTPYQADPSEDEKKLVGWARDRLREQQAAKQAPPPPAEPPPETPLERYDRLAQSAIRAFDSGKHAESIEHLQAIWPQIQQFGDVGLMVMLGYAAISANRETLAIEAMTEAAELTEDDEFYQSLADALLHFERYEDASVVIARMAPSPDRDARLAELAMIQAEQARQMGDHDTAHALLLANEEVLPPAGLEQLGWQFHERGQAEQAAARFEAAYRRAPSESRAQGLVFSLHPRSDHARLLTIVEETEGPLDPLIDEDVRNRIAAGHRHFSVDSQARLEAVSALAGGTPPGLSLRLGPEIRKKRGTPGEGKLSQRGLMLQANWQDAANDLHLEIERQRADNHVERATGQRVYGLWRHRLDNGLQTRLGLGRTLSGGAVDPALIGEVGLAYQQADHGGGLRLFRRGNEESLLALAGQRDPATGANWGRVLETGVQLDGRLSLNPGKWEVIGSLTFSALTGEQVADNRKVELYAHALHPVASVNGLRLGPELYSARFRHNLGFFEPGHGGYFSPRFHLKPGLLADYSQRIGERVDIEARAGLGWGWNRQAAADGNPLRGEDPGKYAASRDNGIAYHGRIQAVWEITPHWQAGLHAGGQKSPEYTDWRGGIFLQWRWGK